jgi:hypothetical protein
MYSAVSGNVGIGTATPGSKLDVDGHVRISSGSILSLDGSAVENYLEHTGDDLSVIGVPGLTLRGDEFISVSCGPGEVINIDEYGLVGIGMDNPSSTLDVNGRVESSTGGFRFPDGTTQITAAASDGHSLDAADGSPIDALYVDNDGDVGIGTVSPARKLDVRTTSGIGIYAENDHATLAALYARNYGTGPAARFQTGDVVVYDGNVGIGAEEPAEKLHVAGDIRLDAGGDIAFADDSTRIHENLNDLYLEASDDIYISPVDDIRMDVNTLFVDGYLDRVGVGTTSPQAKLHVEESGTDDLLRVRQAGATKFIVKNDGRVGIGTSGPDVELEVVGNIQVSEEYTYLSSKTHYLQIPACEFQRSSDVVDEGYIVDSMGYGYIYGFPIELRCPVHLPDEATVTQFTVYYYDNHGVFDLSVDAALYARTLYQTLSPTTMASVSDTTSGSVGAVVSSYDNTINLPTIDNTNYQYYTWLILSMNMGYTPDVRFYGCKITYTVDAVNP